MKDRIYFTDLNGTPVSYEAFESGGFTTGLEIEGQMAVYLKTKNGILCMGLRCETEEDFNKFGSILYKQYVKQNKENVK